MKMISPEMELHYELCRRSPVIGHRGQICVGLVGKGGGAAIGQPLESCPQISVCD